MVWKTSLGERIIEDVPYLKHDNGVTYKYKQFNERGIAQKNELQIVRYMQYAAYT
jgi:hypothetical protein